MDFNKYKDKFKEKIVEAFNRVIEKGLAEEKPLEFDNRTFNAEILERFRKAFEVHSRQPSETTAGHYGEFFRYHFIGDTAMAPLADYYVEPHLEELVKKGEK